MRNALISSARRRNGRSLPSVRQYLTLNGTNQYATVTGHSLNVTGVATLSLVCWLKLGASGNSRRVISLKSTTEATTDTLQIVHHLDGPVMVSRQQISPSTIPSNYSLSAGASGDWVCVALACNGNANELGAGYINGGLATTTVAGGILATTTVGFFLGARPDLSAANFFNGGIGPVYAWNANLTGPQLAAFSTANIGVIPSGLSIPAPDFAVELNGDYAATGGTVTPVNSPSFATYP